jgi:hypothetical protein
MTLSRNHNMQGMLTIINARRRELITGSLMCIRRRQIFLAWLRVDRGRLVYCKGHWYLTCPYAVNDSINVVPLAFPHTERSIQKAVSNATPAAFYLRRRGG